MCTCNHHHHHHHHSVATKEVTRVRLQSAYAEVMGRDKVYGQSVELQVLSEKLKYARVCVCELFVFKGVLVCI
jgi:hypothetical protein